MPRRERLIARRRELNKSQEKLAEDAGVTKRSVIRWEQGGEIRLDMRRSYAHGLGWSLERFMASLAEDDGSGSPANGYHAPRSGLDMLTTLEQTCRELRTLELAICPGLLQTPDYARAVETTSPEQPPHGEVERRVTERMKRQAVLAKSPPLRLLALLDRSILEREVGGPHVMAGLRDHLRAVNGRPNVEIRLLSPAARIAAARGPFQLITGDDPDPFMVVTEDLATGFGYRDGRAVVDIHHDLWSHLWSVSSEVP